MKVFRAVLVVAVAVATSAARADDFETRARTALRIAHVEDVVWAMTASCDKGDDVQQRQCKIVRDRRAQVLAASTLLVDGDADALELGAWSSAKKSLPVMLTGCVRCNGVDVDGHTWFVTSTAPKTDRSKVRAANLYDNARQIADEASANAWKTTAANSRFELIVKAPRKQQIGDKNAVTFDVVAWRVVNACDGNVVISSIPSGVAPGDKRACAKTSGGGGAGDVGGGTVPADTTPDALTPAMVQDGMRPVVAAARACFDRMKVAGRTKLELTITADGTVVKHEMIGDFIGTPTGKCIDEAINKANFAKTKKPTTKIGYPLVLK